MSKRFDTSWKNRTSLSDLCSRPPACKRLNMPTHRALPWASMPRARWAPMRHTRFNQYSNAPQLQDYLGSYMKSRLYSSTVFHHSKVPLHYSTTPPIHYSFIPILHYSTTPTLQDSTTPPFLCLPFLCPSSQLCLSPLSGQVVAPGNQS